MPIIAVIVLALLTGGASAAAEQSLPGDVFYPVKLNLNERVRGAIAFSAEAEADVQTSFAERRLIELEELATKRRLSSDIAASAKERFETHVEKVRAESKRLEEKDAAAAHEIEASLEARLEAHEDIIEELMDDAENSIEDSASLGGILASLTAHLDRATPGGEMNEAALDTVSDGRLDALMRNAEEKMRKAAERVAGSRVEATATSAVAVNASLLERADDALKLAQAQYESGVSAKTAGEKRASFEAFTASLNASWQAEAYAKAALRIGKIENEDEDEDESDSGDNRGKGHATSTGETDDDDGDKNSDDENESGRSDNEDDDGSDAEGNSGSGGGDDDNGLRVKASVETEVRIR